MIRSAHFIVVSTNFIYDQPKILIEFLKEISSRQTVTYITLKDNRSILKSLSFKSLKDLFHNNKTFGKIRLVYPIYVLTFKQFNKISFANNWLYWNYIKQKVTQGHTDVKYLRVILWLFHPDVYFALGNLLGGFTFSSILFDSLDIPANKRGDFDNNLLYYNVSNSFTGMLYKKDAQLYTKVVHWQYNLKNRITNTFMKAINTP